jgi:two-component system LytT family response regulator
MDAGPNDSFAERSLATPDRWVHAPICDFGGEACGADAKKALIWQALFLVRSNSLQPLRPTALVIDDDALARERIKDLNAETGLLEVIGEAADGRTAVAMIDDTRPAVVFLDIRMPLLDGIQVLEAIDHDPAVIFTTAHGDYAVRAFELAAVDYLLKPFGVERFRTAVERAVSTPATSGSASAFERIRSVMSAPEAKLTRLFARERESIVPIDVDEIVRIEASGDYVLVHAKGRRHMMRANLQDLEEGLGERFLRVHRSHLVNLDHVVRFEPHDAARLSVLLSDGSRVVASRARSQDLRRLAR